MRCSDASADAATSASKSRWITAIADGYAARQSAAIASRPPRTVSDDHGRGAQAAIEEVAPEVKPALVGSRPPSARPSRTSRPSSVTPQANQHALGQLVVGP